MLVFWLKVFFNMQNPIQHPVDIAYYQFTMLIEHLIAW